MNIEQDIIKPLEVALSVSPKKDAPLILKNLKQMVDHATEEARRHERQRIIMRLYQNGCSANWIAEALDMRPDDVLYILGRISKDVYEDNKDWEYRKETESDE